jgi:PRC-barrel domain
MAEPMGEAMGRSAGGSVPSLEEARGWVGHRVDGIGDSSIAKVQSLYVDTETGEPVWVLAKLGRFGKVIAIPFLDCAAGVARLWVPYPREVLRGAPPVDPGEPLTREQELAICTHYGVHEDVGRAQEVAACEEGSVTAQASG